MVDDRRAHDPFAPPPAPRRETQSLPRETRTADTTQNAPSGDFEDMTKAELQDLAAEKGLPTSGNKPDLIERLREAP